MVIMEYSVSVPALFHLTVGTVPMNGNNEMRYKRVENK
jgi:hypothetical protein